MTFLTILFFIIIAIWLVGAIFRAAIVRWLRNRASEFGTGAGANRHQNQNRGKEGDVTVETGTASTPKKVRRDAGEYVEFEEIRDPASEQEDDAE